MFSATLLCSGTSHLSLGEEIGFHINSNSLSYIPARVLLFPMDEVENQRREGRRGEVEGEQRGEGRGEERGGKGRTGK